MLRCVSIWCRDNLTYEKMFALPTLSLPRVHEDDEEEAIAMEDEDFAPCLKNYKTFTKMINRVFDQEALKEKDCVSRKAWCTRISEIVHVVAKQSGYQEKEIMLEYDNTIYDDPCFKKKTHDLAALQEPEGELCYYNVEARLAGGIPLDMILTVRAFPDFASSISVDLTVEVGKIHALYLIGDEYDNCYTRFYDDQDVMAFHLGGTSYGQILLCERSAPPEPTVKEILELVNPVLWACKVRGASNVRLNQDGRLWSVGVEMHMKEALEASGVHVVD